MKDVELGTPAYSEGSSLARGDVLWLLAKKSTWLLDGNRIDHYMDLRVGMGKGVGWDGQFPGLKQE